MWDDQVNNCLTLIFKVSWVFPHELLVLLLGLIIHHIAQEERSGNEKYFTTDTAEYVRESLAYSSGERALFVRGDAELDNVTQFS